MVTTDLSLALLGPPVVRRDGAPVTFDTRKATALLALLAVTGREHSREQLADLLWPEADTAKSRASLRRTLSVTAAAMGDGLSISRAAVALDPALVRVDVREFGALIGRPDAASLERAAALYRDDFLTGFTLRGCPEFEEWQESVSEGLRQDLARGLQRLVAACIADGELERAAAHARRWLQLDPLHEPAHQVIIRLYGWAGQRSAAMRQYRSLVRVLDRDLAVRPLPETTRLYDDVRAGRLGPPPVPARPLAEAKAAAVAPEAAAPDEPGAGDGATVAAPLTWPLVGRDAELAALRAAWREAGRSGGAGGSGRVVAVAGQAGSGKTRLVAELRAEAAGAGAAVLAARCHDGETELPFVLAADLLRTALAIRPDLPEILPPQTAAMAGRLVPALAASQLDAETAPPLDSPLAVTRLYAAIADTLQAAAGTGAGRDGKAAAGDGTGVAGIVVVEDVQWADSSSLGLLAYLVRRLANWPLLLVLSWQPEQASRLRVLRTALGEAETQGMGQTVEPGLLGPEAIGTLLGLDGMPRVDVSRLLAETHGLPMLVREYVEALRAAQEPGAGPGDADTGDADTGDADTGEPGAWWPPASVRDLLRTRLQAVSEGARQMLTAAAVLGSDNDAELLRAVSGRGEDEIVEAIDEALARSLLTEIPPPSARQAPSYGFPYEALRRTAYESATLARRRLLHGRAADALTRRYERDPATTRAATVASHLQLAGREADAAQWWWRAAEVARELYAHAEAHAHLTKALALGYPQLPGRMALGEALVALGRYREALAEFETAAALTAEGDRATQAAIEHKLADVHHRLGDWDLADAHLAVVTELVEGTEPGRLARALADRAVVAYRRGAVGQAAALGRAALASARAAADPGATAQALNVLGMLAARSGDTAAAESYLRDSLAEARPLEPGAAVAALNNLARLLAETDRGPEALTAAAEALELGRELGDQHRMAALHTNLADLLHADGQRDAAMTHLKEAARRFAAVDVGDAPRPEIWTLVEW